MANVLFVICSEEYIPDDIGFRRCFSQSCMPLGVQRGVSYLSGVLTTERILL